MRRPRRSPRWRPSTTPSPRIKQATFYADLAFFKAVAAQQQQEAAAQAAAHAAAQAAAQAAAATAAAARAQAVAAPAAAPPPVPAAAPSGASSDATSTNTADWACIRQHESGDNYGAGGGGAYQFQDGTWTGVTGLPASGAGLPGGDAGRGRARGCTPNAAGRPGPLATSAGCEDRRRADPHCTRVGGGRHCCCRSICSHVAGRQPPRLGAGDAPSAGQLAPGRRGGACRAHQRQVDVVLRGAQGRQDGDLRQRSPGGPAGRRPSSRIWPSSRRSPPRRTPCRRHGWRRPSARRAVATTRTPGTSGSSSGTRFDGYPTAGSAPLSVQLAWEARHVGGPPDAPGQCHSY